MTSYFPAKKGVAYLDAFSLPDFVIAGSFRSAPTIAAGDFKISKDGGAYANLTNLPTSVGIAVLFSLTSTEMNADIVTIACIDQTSPKEWCDTFITIRTAANQIDDLALQSTLNTVASYVDTEVAAIKAKTDNLPSDPADASDIAASFSTVNNTLAIIAGYIDTEVGAIKAKTDNLPSDPADASDIAASFIALQSHGDGAWATGSAAPTAAAVADEVVTRTLNANIVKVNNVTIGGSGTTGTPFGPA